MSILRMIGKFISISLKLIYDNLTNSDKEYWYFITVVMKYKHHITNHY